jgi:cytochrome c553
MLRAMRRGEGTLQHRVRRRLGAWRGLALLPGGAIGLWLHAPAGATAATDLAYGAYLAAECATCHGPAAAASGIPALDALPPDRLAAILAAYRDGDRPDPTMRAVARSLGEPEVAALVAYLASRPEP